MPIKIITDSTCSLPRELTEAYDITILPLYITVGERALPDRAEVTARDVFDHVAAGGDLPTTAAVNVQRFGEAFSLFGPRYDGVLCITIGSGFSACYQNACIAARDFPNVRVVDSASLSSGQGIVVLQAARLAGEGLSLEEIDARLKEIIPRIDASFVLDRLDYMKRGGRCSAVTALGANLLHIKPCIEIRNGEMTVGKKYRGAMSKIMVQYVTDRLASRGIPSGTEAFLPHPPGDPAAVEAARRAAEADGRFSRIWEVDAGTTVACHCGPNTVGLMFLTAEAG